MRGNCVGGGGSSIELLVNGTGGGMAFSGIGVSSVVTVEVTGRGSAEVNGAATGGAEEVTAEIAAALAAAMSRGCGVLLHADGGGIVPLPVDMFLEESLVLALPGAT